MSQPALLVRLNGCSGLRWIGQVAIDPILPVKAFMDIGGAGHRSDAMAIWICQFVGRLLVEPFVSRYRPGRAPASSLGPGTAVTDLFTAAIPSEMKFEARVEAAAVA